MNKKNRKLFNRLRELNLPHGEYAVFGSGPLAIRDIIECQDLDVIVTNELFSKLRQDSRFVTKRKDKDIYLDYDGIEIWCTWAPGEWDIEELIVGAETIDELPFVLLGFVIIFKIMHGREKDWEHLKLLGDYWIREGIVLGVA